MVNQYLRIKTIQLIDHIMGKGWHHIKIIAFDYMNLEVDVIMESHSWVVMVNYLILNNTICSKWNCAWLIHSDPHLFDISIISHWWALKAFFPCNIDCYNTTFGEKNELWTIRMSIRYGVDNVITLLSINELGCLNSWHQFDNTPL